MKRLILGWVVPIALTGCVAAPDNQPTKAKDGGAAQDVSQNQTESVLNSMREGLVTGPVGAPVKLYEEVKRLNAACVRAGGGVSGSPDCYAASEKEAQLEKLGYCVDYPHKGKLARCVDLTQRP